MGVPIQVPKILQSTTKPQLGPRYIPYIQPTRTPVPPTTYSWGVGGGRVVGNPAGTRITRGQMAGAPIMGFAPYGPTEGYAITPGQPKRPQQAILSGTAGAMPSGQRTWNAPLGITQDQMRSRTFSLAGTSGQSMQQYIQGGRGFIIPILAGGYQGSYNTLTGETHLDTIPEATTNDGGPGDGGGGGGYGGGGVPGFDAALVNWRI